MEVSKGVTIQAPSATGYGSVPAPRVGVRGYRSTQHLWAARRAARETSELEGERAGVHVPSIEVEASATNAVLLSVAFMEAFVNEILQDVAESEPGDHSARCQGIDEGAAAMIKAV